jgi:type IV pilus assembly protein PilE
MHRPVLGRAPRAWQRGFTLIEVMIVVAIVAILSSVAYPAYTDYVRRGQLQEAFTNLANYRIQMEQYYQDNGHHGLHHMRRGSRAVAHRRRAAGPDHQLHLHLRPGQ